MEQTGNGQRNNDNETSINPIAVIKPLEPKRKTDDANITASNNNKKRKSKTSESATATVTNEDEHETGGKSHDDGVDVLTLMPKRDLKRMLERITNAIPPDDAAVYKTRVKKLNWQEIAFDNYTADKCRQVWDLVQKQQRHFRILGEVVTDARVWLKRRTSGSGRHPDMPRKPLSSYMVFFLDCREAMLLAHPGVRLPELSTLIANQYHGLDESVREKYVQLAAQRRQKYELELKEFYRKHPEIARSGEDSHKRSRLKKNPKPPRTPFDLYFASLPNSPSLAQSKADWKSMKESDKLVWINSALEMNKCNENNENAEVKKNFLTKQEKQLKRRMDGKPEKPPSSAYGLYSSILLKSEEMKIVESKERMKLLALRWNQMPETEKETYRDRVGDLTRKYKQDYANYLESLPEDKRELELKSNAPASSTKRKHVAKQAPTEQTMTDKKIKKEDDGENEETVVEKVDKNYLLGMVTPQTWDDMPDEEKSMYAKYIQKIKDCFDLQHENTLKGPGSSSTDSQSDSESSLSE